MLRDRDRERSNGGVGVDSERAHVYQDYSWKQKRLIVLKVLSLPARPSGKARLETVLGNEEGFVLEVGCWDVEQREGAERLLG